ncbi:hypothetical protein ACHAQJ_007400 [Trichoderma viride]
MPRGTSHASVPDPRRLAPGPASNPASTSNPAQGLLPARHIGCSGTRPRCLSCVRRDSDCQYVSATSAETKSEMLKRKIEEEKQKSSEYQEFYEAVRNMPDKDFQATFRLVRQGADIGTVLRHIKEGNLLLQPP